MALPTPAAWASPFAARQCWKAARVAAGARQSCSQRWEFRSVSQLRIKTSPQAGTSSQNGKVHLKPFQPPILKSSTKELKETKESKATDTTKAPSPFPTTTPAPGKRKTCYSKRSMRLKAKRAAKKAQILKSQEEAEQAKADIPQAVPPTEDNDTQAASQGLNSLAADKWSTEIKGPADDLGKFGESLRTFNATGWGPDRLKPTSASGFPTPDIAEEVRVHSATTSTAAPSASPSEQASQSSMSKMAPFVSKTSQSRFRWVLPGFMDTSLTTGQDVQSARKVFSRRDSIPLRQPDNNDDYLPIERVEELEDEDLEWWTKTGKWSIKVGGRLSALEIDVQPVNGLREMQVANLAHGLDRVLFNPGIHWLRDTRSGIYNYDPRIRNLLDVDLFDYAALTPYVTSSQDNELAQIVQREGKRYSGSTSSMTGLLSHAYFAISAWKQPQLKNFTEPFQSLPGGFSYGAKLPSSIVLRRFIDEDTSAPRYAIDADKSTPGGGADNSNYVLTQLGKSMEKMLTSSPEEYAKFTRINSHQLSEEERTRPEAYHYAKSDKFVMRSQLDCSDDRLPRKTFDLKTRAVIAVRQDRANWVESSGYQIRHATGLFESFEREMWDMNRSAFLKYYFQARIGHMDGIFVAFHSTAAMYGFQYIPLEDMAESVFGSVEMGEQAFRLTIGLVEKLLDKATELFPNDSLKITLDAEQSHDPVLNAFVEPDRPIAPEEEEMTKAEEMTQEEEGSQAEPRGASAKSKKRSQQNGKEKAQEPSIVQLQVSFDRYLSDAHVTGPVDFSAAQGRPASQGPVDEIERRRHAKLPSLEWSLEYAISPCSYLSQNQIRQNLAKIRKRQESVAPLLLPNVEAINEREEFRERELAKNPEALKRFWEDRRSGAAVGMPMAPGQTPIRTEGEMPGIESSGEEETSEDVEGAATAKTSTDRGNETKWKKINEGILRLRQLAKLGREDAEKREGNDRLEMYKRRGD